MGWGLNATDKVEVVKYRETDQHIVGLFMGIIAN